MGAASGRTRTILWGLAGISCWLAVGIAAAPIPVEVNGPASNRVNIVFLGDGYLASDLDTTYVTHINAMLDHFFRQGENPYPRYEKYFNVYRINVTSNDRGADVPPLGVYHDTALDASYYWDGSTDRLLYVNEAKANAALSSGLAGSGITANIKMVTVNDTRYGGGGGTYAVYAGGNSSATEIALHENGHSFDKFADEYSYAGTTYTGGEPSQVDITKDPTGAKWSRWLGYNDPNTGVVGAYEGAYYNQYGIYRPSPNSKMRTLGYKYDPIQREKIILDIYNIVKPLDSYLANATTLTDPKSLWVQLVDPNVEAVQWLVNGSQVTGAAGEALDPTSLGLANGTYTFTAHAFDTDPNGWVRADNSSMQETINWTVTLTPEPATATAFGALLALVLCRRRQALPAA